MTVTLIETGKSRDRLTSTQRSAHYITIAVAIVALLIGLTLRSLALNRTSLYTNLQVGINAQYPENWLIDSEGDYVVRMRDMSFTGFKTTFQISVRPLGDATTARNILDSLSLSRAQTFTDYNPSPVESYLLPNGTEAQSMTYTFVSREASPFLESVPLVIGGQDIIIISRGQAIVVTYRADSAIFDQQLPRFRQFLASLEF